MSHGSRREHAARSLALLVPQPLKKELKTPSEAGKTELLAHHLH